MGYKIKKVLVHDAALGAAALVNSDSVFVRGAAFVYFHVTATDANQLAANTIVKTSLDGTTFVSTSSSNCANGGVISNTTGFITTPLNTGGVLAILNQTDRNAGSAEGNTPFRPLKALLTMQAPAGGIAGVKVYAFVGYEYEGETAIVSFADDIGPNV